MHHAGWLLALMLSSSTWAVAAVPAGEPVTSPAPGLQVWLETKSNEAGQTVVLPYLKTSQTIQVLARVSVTTKGSAGSALVSQQASLQVPAGQPTLLTRLTFGLATHDDCHADLVLSDLVTSRAIGKYRFNCKILERHTEQSF